MEEYNKSIEELLNEFENFQLTEIVKQVNMQSGVPIESVWSNNPLIMNKKKLLTPLETIEEQEQIKRQKTFIIEDGKILMKNLNQKALYF